MLNPFFKSDDKNFYLLKGDSFELLPKFDHKFDMVFADPPYFLSNGGLSVQNGKIVSVNKGDWDKSQGVEHINDFNREWLTLIRDKMKENATIWISGTMHNIFSVGQLLTELGFKILNIITWEKTNPPPNFSCRYFTFSTELIIWARKNQKVSHFFNYELMKELNGDKQMKDVWKLPAIAPWEKTCKKHPTQKPLSVLTRLILASTKPNAWILDPFAGSSTTGIAANLANRRFLGIDKEEEFLTISRNRKIEIENLVTAESYRNKIAGFIDNSHLTTFLKNEPSVETTKVALGFCKKKEISRIKKGNLFYFHAIENGNRVKDFPVGILEAKKLILYSGGRSQPAFLTGLCADIVSVKLKHKSEIAEKVDSKTEFYYEIKLNAGFIENETLQFKIERKSFFKILDAENVALFKQYLPVLTTYETLSVYAKQQHPHPYIPAKASAQRSPSIAADTMPPA